MHHAYIYEGPLAALAGLAKDARTRFQFADLHDPNVQVLEFEKFGIDEARELKEMASLKSTSGRALFIIATGSMTVESQQALLKLFEEPQAGSIFILLVPQGSVLPTLRSRFLPYPQSNQQGSTLLESARSNLAENFGKRFLALPYTSRSAEITKLLKDDEGVRERVRDLLSGLESELYKNVSKNEEVRSALADIAKVRSYSNDRSPSFKMLLEHLAVVLPKL
ncbi:hypothetical protein H7X87_02440 [Acetobacteraceae bacterium]|nr:hypothetical protein [Candidatus Parcubacteria bacterium]